MSRRDAIKTLFAEQLAAANTGGKPPLEAARMPAGPVRAMGLSLEKMEQETKALHDQLAAGAAVVELPAGLIEASFVADRIADPDDQDYHRLRESIRENGQEVPILVRPHPDGSGRYQAAYGHRRLRAAADLGIPVKAIVREMPDAALVIAQGIENSARRDLSFIERALFALALEQRRFDRATIMQSLSTDKTELSKLLSVAHSIPEALIRWIGPAPRTGRRRWLDLALLLGPPEAAKRALSLTRGHQAAPAASDARFQLVAAALQPRHEKLRTAEVWTAPGGDRAGLIKRAGDRLTIEIDQQAAPGFGDFVAGQLDALYRHFRSG